MVVVVVVIRSVIVLIHASLLLWRCTPAALHNHDLRTGPFDAAASPGAHQQAWTLGGAGWYRKSFPAVPAGTRVFLRFDGVYMDSTVWVNGNYAGNWPYGYTTFEYDVTPFVHFEPNGARSNGGAGGGVNVVAVRAANMGVNTRWYAGSGIYRHTWLSIKHAAYIPMWGVQVSTPSITMPSPNVATAATVAVNVTVVNAGTAAVNAQVVVEILKGESRTAACFGPPGSCAPGAAVATVNGTVTIPSTANATLTLHVELSGPVLALWSTKSPNLYTANATVTTTTSGASDSAAATFGIRHIKFDSSNGFQLNGETVKMFGGCVHHSNGPLGAMAIDRADERRVESLKRLGYNAIRTSHNPASPAFLDACDRLGVLVMAEAFDCWADGKNPGNVFA